MTPEEVPVLQARVGRGGAHQSLWNNFINWCDNNISASLNSNTDFDEHLYRYALAHILTPGDQTYGNRAIAILTYLANSGSGDWSPSRDRSGGDGNEWWFVASALAVAYDWTHDMINGHANEETIEAYLEAVIEKDTGDGTWSGRLKQY